MQEKQVDLFGSDMAKRQTEGSTLRQNINCWLADNCFGYPRSLNAMNIIDEVSEKKENK